MCLVRANKCKKTFGKAQFACRRSLVQSLIFPFQAILCSGPWDWPFSLKALEDCCYSPELDGPVARFRIRQLHVFFKSPICCQLIPLPSLIALAVAKQFCRNRCSSLSLSLS